MTANIEHITEMTAQERAAYVTFRIVEGEEMTTAEIARRVGVTHDGALKLMYRVSRVIPVYQSGRVWTVRR